MWPKDSLDFLLSHQLGSLVGECAATIHLCFLVKILPKFLNYLSLSKINCVSQWGSLCVGAWPVRNSNKISFISFDTVIIVISQCVPYCHRLNKLTGAGRLVNCIKLQYLLWQDSYGWMPSLTPITECTKAESWIELWGQNEESGSHPPPLSSWLWNSFNQQTNTEVIQPWHDCHLTFKYMLAWG